MSDVCTLCDDGYVSDPQAAFCTKCGLGSVANNNQSACDPCSAGTYSIDSINCLPCAGGSVSTEGLSACNSCPAGKTPNSNSSDCEFCGIGKFSGIGAPMCSPCLPGTHAPEPGTTECIRCVTTFGAGFSSFEGSASCKTCVFEGSASCETCVQRYYFEDTTCKVSA